MENLHKDYREHGTPPGGETAELSPEEIRALIQENENLRQELRIRDNDILSHDQVFDSIVSGTLHVILVMSVTTFHAEFITSNLENALGVQTGEALEDVRRISPAFEDIEKYDRREETFIHRTNGSRRQYLIYVIHLPYGRSDRVAVVLLCTSNAAKGDLEEMMLQQTQDINRAAGYFRNASAAVARVERAVPVVFRSFDYHDSAGYVYRSVGIQSVTGGVHVKRTARNGQLSGRTGA